MQDKDKSLPLWRLLQGAAGVVQDVCSGVSGNAAMAAVHSDLRPGVQSLAFAALRSLGRAQALRQLLVDRTPSPPADALLCTALALSWQEHNAPYEAFTLVNQAVEAAKRTTATRQQASFINACLRRFLRERTELINLTDKNPMAVWNHPKWWIDRLQADWPKNWQAILAANNRQAPMTLRINVRQTSTQSYLEVLRAKGLHAFVTGPSAITLEQPRGVDHIPGFFEGAVSVQDSAAQRAAPLLLTGMDLGRPLKVLDACAAPGGKTAHLIELANCQITALDVDPLRCKKIHQTLSRLGLTATVIAADASNAQSWWDGLLFDAILLDAPCSASGIVRRHPDVRWLRRASDIKQLADIQARLLEAMWPMLKPGGRLLYCTCSVFRAEGEDQIQTFLRNNTDAALLPSAGHLLPTGSINDNVDPDNQDGDHDGFYYALLEKRAA